MRICERIHVCWILLFEHGRIGRRALRGAIVGCVFIPSSALGALVYGFGPFSMLHGWLYALVPFADKARSPSHVVFVFQFALFLLAAHGIDRFFAPPQQDDGVERWLRYIQYTLIAFGAVVLLSVVHFAVQGKLTPDPARSVHTGRGSRVCACGGDSRSPKANAWSDGHSSRALFS